MFKYLINTHDDVYSKVRGLNFGVSLHLHPHYAYASSKDSGESVPPEPSLLADAIRTKVLCARPYILAKNLFCFLN